jgi:hypothetical protein
VSEVFSLQERRALVTGAGTGIGRAIVRALAMAGASVAVTDLNLTAAQAVAGEIGAQGIARRLATRARPTRSASKTGRADAPLATLISGEPLARRFDQGCGTQKLLQLVGRARARAARERQQARARWHHPGVPKADQCYGGRDCVGKIEKHVQQVHGRLPRTPGARSGRLEGCLSL